MIHVNLPVEFWDGLKTKEELYQQFDKLSNVEQGIYNADPAQPMYYKDDEFKEVGERLRAAAEVLRPMLLDVAAHYTDVGELCRNEAIDRAADLPLDTHENIAVYAWTMYLLLDSNGDNSFIKHIESGSGIPEARAAYRAYARYRTFKDVEDKQMEEFKKTPEYRMQETEMKLGLRDFIELPKEGD